MESATRDTQSLLALLDHFVATDDGAPGISGRLAIGVQNASQVTWWQVSLSHAASAAFVPAPDQNCDAVLLIGEAEARSIVSTGDLPEQPGLLRARGDRSLLHAFVNRYVKAKSAVSLRVR